MDVQFTMQALRSSGVTFSCAEFNNRLTDEEAAFGLLHLLRHLSGCVFESTNLSCLNSAIVEALLKQQYQHNMLPDPAGSHRIFARRYIVGSTLQNLSFASAVGSPQHGRGASADGDAKWRFIGAREVFALRPSQHDILQLINTCGAHCRELECSTEGITAQQLDQIIEVREF